MGPSRDDIKSLHTGDLYKIFKEEMEMKKRIIAAVLAGIMAVGMFAGCGSSDAKKSEEETAKETEKDTEKEAEDDTEGEDPFLTGEKPVLNILTTNASFDNNEDPAIEIMKEVSGYDVVFHQLPSENTTEKLMLELASGGEYDLICVISPHTSVFGELVDKKALTEVDELLEKYGQDILSNVSEAGWSSVNADGTTYGVPSESARHSADDISGAISSGLAFRSDVLEDLGKEIPTNLDELYDVLKAFKDKTGNAPLTLAKDNGAFVADIMSAFGLGSAYWYDVDGEYTYVARTEGFKEYIAYMQKLYKEGLLDADMPINASENAKEKFLNSALCTFLWFWEIPSLKESLEAINPEAKVVFAPSLGIDESDPGLVVEATGIGRIFAIPKTAQNPEHAMIFLNSISQMDNFKKIYIGEENVSYEMVDGKYYPLFPEFTNYSNSNEFVGAPVASEQAKMWEARARKTPEMAEAFDQMNANANDKNYYFSPEAYAGSLPAMTEYYASLQSTIKDIVIKGIVEGADAQAVVDEAIEAWERDGGLECEQAMQEWYTENKHLFE